MKTRILFLIALISSVSCSKWDDDGQCDCNETQIRLQIKEIVDAIFKGCEEVDAAKVTQSCYGSPDFTYVFGGKIYDYLQFYDALTEIYGKMLNQVVTVVHDEIDVLDNSTAVYTNNCTFVQDYKDQSTILIDPVAMLFIFKKMDGKWTWIYGVESYGD